MAKVCLDAGHYGKYNRSPVVKSYYESDMNWKLHLLLEAELKAMGVEVVKTRAAQQKDLSLDARGKASKGCDLFLSIHSNAASSESVDYPVAYALQDDTTTKIDDLSQDLAEKLAKAVEQTMGTRQAGRMKTRKASYDRNGDGLMNDNYYGVLHAARQVGTPAVLLEHSFHTNTRATKWLLELGNLEKLAKAEAAVIADFLGMRAPSTEPAAPTTPQLYRVQVGAYKLKLNAQKQLQKVAKAGFDAFIAKGEDSFYRVQVGAYTVRENALAQLRKVSSAGFPGFVTSCDAPAASELKSTDEVAREVIAGKWGNGKERKTKLQAAGYNYETIQARVNELLD